MKTVLSGFCMLLLASVMLAQQDSIVLWNPNSFSFCASIHGGFIVPHTAQMSHLVQGHSWGTELVVERRTCGTALWQQHYQFPSHGLRYFFLATGNDHALGQQHSLVYSLRLPLDRLRSDRFFQSNSARPLLMLNYHDLIIGIGTGYATKTWNLRENHQAPVIGSHINTAITIQYQAHINLGAQTQLNAGIKIMHFSNGAFKVPNLGTNNLSLFVGYQFTRKGSAKVYLQTDLPAKRWATTWSIAVAAGAKEIQPPMGRKYSAFSISTLHDRRMNHKSTLGLGIDVFYNTSLKPLIERYQNETPSFIKQMQIGGLFSYTIHFNMVELKMQQGVYIKDDWKNDGLFYNRFGLRYCFTKNIFVQLMLKTHFAKADYGEIGVGWCLHKTQ